MKAINEIPADLKLAYGIEQKDGNLYIHKCSIGISGATNALWEDKGNYIQIHAHNVKINLFKNIITHSITILEP